MTTDNRKIQLGVAVDATGAKQGFQDVKDAGRDMAQAVQQSGKEAAKGLDGVGAGAGTAATKVDAATRSLIGSIQRTTAAQAAGSKSSSEYYRVLAEQRGVNADALKPYLAQLDAVSARTRIAATETEKLQRLTTSLGATAYQKPLGNPTTSLGATPFGQIAVEANKAGVAGAAAMDKIGMSAKATQAALRGVPAQFTDIAVSLQGGQNPLTVLLQQGGQLKDMFGGIGPAARALGGYVLGLVNPFTVAAAAAAGLAYAFSQGAEENAEYRRTLILTGNVAGLTASQLQLMARSIDGTIGTQYQAADALAAIASTGLVAGADLEKFATTAVRVQRTVGVSVQQTAKIFEELGREPLKASEKLNESMNYLTLTVYDQIKALQEQGRESEAASVAQRAYSDAMDVRTAKLESNLGAVQKAWRAVSDAAKEGWDEILGIGRPDLPGEAAAPRWKAAALATMIPGVGVNALAGEGGRALGRGIGELFTTTAEREAAAENTLLEKRGATIQAQIQRENALAEKAKIAARSRDDARVKATRSRADQRKDEIKQLDVDAKILGLSVQEYDKRAASINEKYKDPKVAKTKAYQDDAGTRMLETLRQQEASLKAQLVEEGKITEAQKEQAKFAQLLVDLKDKKVLTADQKSLVANQEAIKAQLAKNVAVADEVELKKEAEKLDKKAKQDAAEFLRQIEGINISMASSRDSRSDQQSRALEAYGLGDRARQEVDAQRSIRREYEAYKRQLTKDAAEKNQLGSDAYKAEVEKIQASLNDALAGQQAYFDALREKQADWRNGASESLQNFYDESRNVAGQISRAFTNAFDGLEDVIKKFVKTGKLDIKSLAQSIVDDITGAIIKAQISGPLSKALMGSMGSGGSGFGGLLSSGLNSLFGGGGWGTGNAFGNLDIGMFLANGGVMRGPGISAYSGSVVSKPTLFPFAKGVGLMGEAGEEAILPLKRGPDGRLGVESGGSGRSAPNVTINMPAGTDRKIIGHAATEISATLRRWDARNG